MTTVSVTRHISAQPAQIWSVLTNIDVLASGGFGITKLEGSLRNGGRIRLWSDVAPNRAFYLRVALQENSDMTWIGGMPFGLFKGVRRFHLKPSSTGTQFSMTETFSGLFAGRITKAMPDLQPSFDQFADALAKHAEKESQ